ASLVSLAGCMLRAEMPAGRAFASNLGLTVFAREFFAAGSPAAGEVAFAVLPTYSPEGKSPLLFLPDPAPFAVPFPALAPAAPEAPRCPSGEVAKLPRRLPAGGFGGAPTAG